MAASETGTTARGVTSSWRELGRMRAHQVPMVLGGVVAVLAGLVTFAQNLVKDGANATLPIGAIYLVAFGVLGLIAYAISKENLKNGAVVAAIAGLALLLLGGGAAGLLTGLLLVVGAVWGFAKAS
mgnify:CR=1 FL=1